jgi:hypothetical protein
VIEYVWTGIEHDAKRLFQTLKIRNQDLNSTTGGHQANLANGLGKNLGAPNIVIVPVNAGYNGMFDAEASHRFGHSLGFFIIDWPRLALGNRAESAAAGANVAEQHERRSAVIPALADVGTLRRFADSVQSKPASELLQVMEVVADRGSRAQPPRFGLARCRTHLDLN